MKKIVKNACITLASIALPTLLAMACVHILTAVVILATLLTVEIMFINYRRDYWSVARVRIRKVYSFLGIAIAVGSLAISMPPQLAIIIALCVLIIGVVQLALEEPFGRKKMLWLKIWENQNETEGFAIVEYIMFLAISLFFVLMVVANFGSQTIWLPLITCGLIVYTVVRGDLFCFSDDLSVKIFSFIALAVTGIVSTLIQFNEARIFGILIWVIGLVIGIILILLVIYLYWRAAVQEKRRIESEKIAEKERQETERKTKEALQKSLTERISELSWEEIWTGFNRINEEFGMHLFLSSPNLKKLGELVTVSNEKMQIFWSNDLSRMFQIMEVAARKVQDDEQLQKILDACSSIENAFVTKASKIGATYKGESEFCLRLYAIRKLIRKNI